MDDSLYIYCQDTILEQWFSLSPDFQLLTKPVHIFNTSGVGCMFDNNDYDYDIFMKSVLFSIYNMTWSNIDTNNNEH